MCKDLSSGFKQSALSADSEQKGNSPFEHPEQKSSMVDKKQQLTEPELISQILPSVMADIKSRRERQSFQRFDRFLFAGDSLV